MQAVILAAGMGSRLGKYTQSATKCMIKVNRQTLLERIFDSLRLAGIKKAVIITGHCADALRKHACEAAGDDIELTFIHNDKYSVTNNIYSLYLAAGYMSADDTVLFESDLIFDEAIVRDILDDPYPDLVTVSKFESWMDGTVTTFDRNGNVLAFIDKSGFNWDNCEQYYKTVNIYKLSCSFFREWYLPFLEAYIKTCGNNAYYEMVLKIITNICTTKLKVFDVTGRKWYEIDTPQDLQTAETIFNEEGQLSDLQSRFGGYWRFDRLRDYCYLVNPWFPTERMKNELVYNFDRLLTQYPSGQRIIRTAMTSLLECSENYICVGNGAAELIRIICRNMHGSCFVVVPSFNEYINSLTNAELHFFDCSQSDFQYDADSIIDKSAEDSAVLLINPDNPTGNFIGYDDMLRILDACRERGQRIIVDESFIDFAEQEKKYTLITDDILEKYPQLIVIKSISKSYGIPGIRLGVLCSSDEAVIQYVNSELPIWNINSFAEYFMQIFPKYKSSYENSCCKLSLERERFSHMLKKTGKLEVYPSQANFIMCRLREGSTEELTNELLKNDFLIKDLSSKQGCRNEPLIRIAVRTPEENDLLTEMIGKISFKGE